MDPTAPELELDNLRVLKVLGKGATGTVLLVHDKSRDPCALSPYALKIIPKSSLQQADQRARWELSVLIRLSNPTCSHPSLPILLGFFETRHLIGWATPFCPGGDLNTLRLKNPDRSFSLGVIRFYLSQILCALDHLHIMGIVYRDLKPENVLVQQSGHLTLTDFDLSCACLQDLRVTDTCHTPKWRSYTMWSRSRVSPVTRLRSSCGEGQRSRYSFVGTEEYVSPEMLRGGIHGFAVDWWSFGILAYEMLYGTTPFKGKNKKETYFNILIQRPQLVGKQTALTDLIGRLLEKDQSKRIGYGTGANEIKRHEFFRGVRWDLLTDISRPPIIPSCEEKLKEKLFENGVDVREYFREIVVLPESLASSLYSVSVDAKLQI